MNKNLIYVLFFFAMPVMAAEIYIHYPPVNRSVPTSFLEFQVIENSVKLDNGNIFKAAIATGSNGEYVGLEVTVKPGFIKELGNITEHSVGKQLNLVINKRIVATSIIQTALGRKFLITSLPREEAYAFLDTLDYFKYHRK